MRPIHRYDWIAPTRFDKVFVPARYPPNETVIEIIAMPPMFADDSPDRKYWTDYDHFMIEREARAQRRAHLYRLFGAWFRAMHGGIARSVNAASSGLKPARRQA